MKLSIKKNNMILLIVSMISFAWLLFILYQINMNLAEAINIDKLNFELLDYLIGFGHIFILLFHFYAIIFILIHFHHFKELRIFKTVLLVLGIISLFSMGVVKVMVDEIAKEYPTGHSGEFYILNFAYLMMVAYLILLFFFILKTFKIVSDQSAEDELVDEKIFTIAQFMGILSGIMGLFLTFSLVGNNIPPNKLWIYIPFYILFLIPYGLAVIYWLSLKFKEKIIDWYDEKQLQDILKSSLITLILSVPGLALFLFIKIPSHFYFFLYYLFLVLLIFSTSTLYFFKIRDVS